MPARRRLTDTDRRRILAANAEEGDPRQQGLKPHQPEKEIMPPALMMLPIEQLRESPFNPRKTYSREELAELIASVQASGVLQPILVRPAQKVRWKVEHGGVMWYAACPAADGKGSVRHHMHETQDAAKTHVEQLNGEQADYEVVFGHRRLRAAREAGLVEVPGFVREMTDLEAMEAQVSENDQRADVLPSERAAGYQRLLAAGRSVPEIAERVGKSPTWVREVLLLARMPAALAAAVDAGSVSRSAAALVCRVGSPEQRELAAVCVLEGRSDPEDYPIDRPLTFRETEDLVANHFQRQLKGASFDPKRKTLTSAGACTTCPKRVGNLAKEDPDTWQGVRADICTDPACYREKEEQYRRETQPDKAGPIVIPPPVLSTSGQDGITDAQRKAGLVSRSGGTPEMFGGSLPGGNGEPQPVQPLGKCAECDCEARLDADGLCIDCRETDIDDENADDPNWQRTDGGPTPWDVRDQAMHLGRTALLEAVRSTRSPDDLRGALEALVLLVGVSVEEYSPEDLDVLLGRHGIDWPEDQDLAQVLVPWLAAGQSPLALAALAVELAAAQAPFLWDLQKAAWLDPLLAYAGTSRQALEEEARRQLAGQPRKKGKKRKAVKS